MPIFRRTMPSSSPAYAFRRLIAAAAIALPLLWVGTWAYAEWQDPQCDPGQLCPPVSQIKGVAWLFDATESGWQTGGLRVSGDMNARGSFVTSKGRVDAYNAVFAPTDAQPDAVVSVVQGGSGKGVYSLALGSGGAAIYGQGVGDPTASTSPGSWAGYFNGYVYAQKYCLAGATPTDPPVCGGAGSPGSSSDLWTLAADGHSIFKTDATQFAAVGATADNYSTLGMTNGTTLPGGVKLGLVGDVVGTGPRLYISNNTGNPEVSFSTSAGGTESHFGLYASGTGTASQLRVWQGTASSGANQLVLGTTGQLSLGPQAVAAATGDAATGAPTTFDLDGVMIFRGWTPTMRRLSVTVSGSGTVTPDPVGTSCGATCWDYIDGTPVTLAATPSGSVFNGWSAGASDPAFGCNGSVVSTCTFNMRADSSVTALFSGTPATITLTKALLAADFANDTSIRITSPDGRVNCHMWKVGSTFNSTGCVVGLPNPYVLTLTFAPEASSVMKNATVWSGGGQKLWDNFGSTCTFSPCVYTNSDIVSKTIYVGVVSSATNSSVTITKAGTGATPATVTSTPAGVYCNTTTNVCGGTLLNGSVTLTANGNGGTFAGWNVGGTGTGSMASCTGTGTCAFTLAQIGSTSNAATATFNAAVVAAPTVTTNAASGLTTTSATLNGSANPNNAATTAWFKWGTANVACASLPNTTSPTSSLGSGSTAVGYTFNLTGLTASTTYYFCAIASNSAGTGMGSVLSFQTSVAPDTTPPTVSITSPAPGASVSNTVTVTASASDNVGVTGVQFKLDGAVLGAEDTTSPYSVSWDTTNSTNASHTLSAVARDAVNNSATSSSVSVTVSNAVRSADFISATPSTAGWRSTPVTFTYTPACTAAAGTTLTSCVTQVSTNSGSTWTQISATQTSNQVYTMANGSCNRFQVVESDTGAAGGATQTIPASGDICLDTSAPATSITSPSAGATVSNTITVSANATDNVGVTGVQFKLDGAVLGAEDTTSPYSVSWNTNTATNGSHTLSAVARDAAGNTTTSGSVSVTVSNTLYVLTAAHTLNRGSITGSVTCLSSCTSNTGSFTLGTTINLIATPAAGYDWTSWTLPAGKVCQETGDTVGFTSDGTSYTCSFTMPGSNATATANFIVP